MGINQLITEEPVLRQLKSTRMTILTKHGILTIEDFINADIDSITNTVGIREQFIALQKILRYKYMNESLPQSILLDCAYKKYLHPDRVMIKYFRELGFYNDFGDRFSEDNDKIIDVLRKCVMNPDAGGYIKELAQFYIDYYDKEKENEHSLDAVETIKNLKKEMLSLTSQIAQLNDKINSLAERLASFEEEETKYGRKF